jgi:concanavalin A-like lectin/glucanase superfamily protein/carbohydrate esterase-like sialic acid-specific acetylesterase
MMAGGVVAAARRRTMSDGIRIVGNELPSRRIYQRTNGVASIPLSGTYSGAAGAVGARVVSALTFAEVVGWTTVSGTSSTTVSSRPIAYWMFTEASGNRASSASATDILVPSVSAPTKVAGPGSFSAVDFVKLNSQQFTLSESGMNAAFPGRSSVSNGSMTIGAWIRIDAETGSDAGILSKGTNFQLIVEGNAVQFRVFSDIDEVAVSAEIQAYPAGVWRHYAARYTQSSGEIALYVNGIKQIPATIFSRKTASSEFIIGTATFKTHFDGAVAELFVCNMALTDSQIASVHANGLSASGLVSVAPLLSWSGALSVPQGGWYRLQYRMEVTPAAVHTATNTFGVGDVWMLAGESQQARLSTLISTPPTPDDRTAVFTRGTSWSLPSTVAGMGGNGIIRFLNLMAAATNVPQGCVQVSVDGTAITDWEAGDGAYLNASTRLTELGTVAGILWHQGGPDIGIVSRADYKTRLAALRTGLQSAATVQRFGVFPLMHRTSAANTDVGTQEMRRAHYEYIAENVGTINLGWTPDVILSDDTNQTAAGSEIIAYAYAHALLFAMGAEATNNLGPSISGASRVGAAVSLAVQHRSGTSLKINSGTVATGFQVFPASATHNDTAALAISGVSLSASAITLTLATDPSAPVDVYYQWGRFDAGSPVFDNTQALGRTTGNALQPLLSPIQTQGESGSVVNPSIALDNSTGHVRYALTGGWNFPDADWTFGVWVRIDDPSGTQSQYIASPGAYGAEETFNFLIYEASHTRPGSVELVVRGAGTTAIVIGGANNASFLNNTWRLFIVERVKVGETLNIYHATPGVNAALYHTGSVSGLGAITLGAPMALGVRAPPLAGSERWLAGSIYSVFRMDGRLTAAEMNQLAKGEDLVTDLAKAPALYTRFNTLTSPIANSGTAANGQANLNGGITLTTSPQFALISNAVQFDKTGLTYTMPKTVSHTMPAGSWTLGFLMALGSNAGTSAQYVYSTGQVFATGVVNVSFSDASHPSTPNQMVISLDDGASNLDKQYVTPSVAALINGNWYLWTIEYDSVANAMRVYYTPVNGSRVAFHTTFLTSALAGLTPPNATVTIGTRQDIPAARYFGGKMHSAFQMDGRPTLIQTQDLARGKDLKTDLGLSPKWYHKFNSTATTLTDLSGNGNTATASGGTPVLVSGPSFTPNS